MDIDINDSMLTPAEKSEVLLLLSKANPLIEKDLEQIWYLLDLVWKEYECDNRSLNWERIGKFYSDPVWILNGLFIEQDRESMMHRKDICNWILRNKCQRVVDYGGGFGTLARLVADADAQIRVSIFEPHPSELGLRRVRDFSNIFVISTLSNIQSLYDCLICTDVLEHVPDPLSALSEMVKSVEIDGHLLIANCFYPVIECHLPVHFHFRYTFDLFIKAMGCERVSTISDSHAVVYRKTKNVEFNWRYLRMLEFSSRKIYPILEFFKVIARPLKRFLRK